MRTLSHCRVPLTSIQDGQTKCLARRGEQHRPQENKRPRVSFKQTGLRHGLPALRHVSNMFCANADRTARQAGSPAWAALMQLPFIETAVEWVAVEYRVSTSLVSMLSHLWHPDLASSSCVPFLSLHRKQRLSWGGAARWTIRLFE